LPIEDIEGKLYEIAQQKIIKYFEQLGIKLDEEAIWQLCYEGDKLYIGYDGYIIMSKKKILG